LISSPLSVVPRVTVTLSSTSNASYVVL
jgi:hypothetical protein